MILIDQGEGEGYLDGVLPKPALMHPPTAPII